MCHRAFIPNNQLTLLQNSAEWAVRPPSSKVAAIPDEASASAILFFERIVANIN